MVDLRVKKKEESDIRVEVNDKLSNQSDRRHGFRSVLRDLKDNFVPRSILGMAMLLVAFAVGIAFSGAGFYAYYNSRLTENEQAVGRFVEGFDQQFNEAAGTLEELRVNSINEIRGELQPLEPFVDSANGIVGLPASVGQSVWIVETRTSSSELSFGSAFAVIGHNGGTALVTSLSVVRAATREPAPEIELVKGDQRLSASLWAWDAASDLALLTTDAAIETLDLASASESAGTVGQFAFAMSGVGDRGATAAPGQIIDLSSVGVQHAIPYAPFYLGGPILNAQGQVVAVNTPNYEPYGVSNGQISLAPDVTKLCSTVLRCSELDQATGVVEAE